jgi:hypothetical protein
VLTLGLIGCEKTKWEVPDENSVKSQGGEEFLEYGGKKEFINISRVLHNFQTSFNRKQSEDLSMSSLEEKKGEGGPPLRDSIMSAKAVQLSFPFKIELPEWLPSSFLAYLGSN